MSTRNEKEPPKKISDDQENDAKNGDSEKVTVTLPGVVDRIIPPLVAGDSEKAQISVEGAEHLYREIRVENELSGEDGDPVKLKKGAEVEVTIAADPADTVKK